MSISVQPYRRSFSTVPENGASLQLLSQRDLAILSGELNAGHFAVAGVIILSLCLFVVSFLYAVNKTCEGLRFFVLPRIWAWICLRPFKPSTHKMLWKWWRAADDDNYVTCLTAAVAWASFCRHFILYWKEQTPFRLRAIMKGWELIRAGSGSWILGTSTVVRRLFGVDPKCLETQWTRLERYRE